jgi:hypothetical protein
MLERRQYRDDDIAERNSEKDRKISSKVQMPVLGQLLRSLYEWIPLTQVVAVVALHQDL